MAAAAAAAAATTAVATAGPGWPYYLTKNEAYQPKYDEFAGFFLHIIVKHPRNTYELCSSPHERLDLLGYALALFCLSRATRVTCSATITPCSALLQFLSVLDCSAHSSWHELTVLRLMQTRFSRIRALGSP